MPVYFIVLGVMKTGFIKLLTCECEQEMLLDAAAKPATYLSTLI